MPINYMLNRDLKLGDISNDVVILQKRLKMLNFVLPGLQEHGLYDINIKRAVFEFQKNFKICTIWDRLVVKGSRVDYKTRKLLNSLTKTTCQ